MKKFLAIVLALVLMLALSIPVFAADPVTHDDVTIAKEYTNNGDKGDLVPSEELKFEVVADPDNKADVPLVVKDIKDTAEGLDVVLDFGEYDTIGVYKYTVTEVPPTPKTAGVTYDELPVEVTVYVVNEKAGEGDEDVLKIYFTAYKLDDSGEPDYKVGGDTPGTGGDFDAAFTNDYGVGSLTVTKNVTGNMASNEAEFTIHVTFTLADDTAAGGDITYSVAGGADQTLAFDGKTATVDIVLKNGESVEFTNIPAGVTYEVLEDEKHTKEADIDTCADDEGYTATYDDAKADGEIAAGDEDELIIENNKEKEIPTGISLDTLPYILIAVAVVAAIVIMVIRKRRYQED